MRRFSVIIPIAFFFILLIFVFMKRDANYHSVESGVEQKGQKTSGTGVREVKPGPAGSSISDQSVIEISNISKGIEGLNSSASQVDEMGKLFNL